VIAGLVLEVFVPSVRSDRVNVRLPAVRNVTLKVLVPETSAALIGKAALLSLEVNPTVSATVFTKFQLASTALAVTVKGVPAVCGDGVPVLPLALPGDAVSPGTMSCILAKRPAFTVIAGLVLAARDPVTSLAVTVRVPAVLKVKLESVPEPPARLRLPVVAPLSSAMAALLSDVVIVTFAVALLTTFQLESTALTDIPLTMAVPALCAVGVPVLPVAVPGAEISPGRSNCNFVTAPGFTLNGALVAGV